MAVNLSRRSLLTSVALASQAMAQTPAGPRRDPNQPLKVAVVSNLLGGDTTGELFRQLERMAAPQRIEWIHLRKLDELRTKGREAEVVFSGMPDGLLDSLPNLKWVQVPGAGVEWIGPALVKSPVVVTNMARMFAPGISETAMGLLLGLTRRIATDYRDDFKARRWQPRGTQPGPEHSELVGKTMGIVGMGGIGSAIARRAHYGFDMRVVGTDARPMAKPEYVAELHDPTWFRTMVPQVDVLVLAAPLTAQTRNLVTEEVFRSMKKGSYFLAMSRGGLFDDKALVKALQEGWIAGAGLDVFPQEPIPADHPIWDCKNVVITPHTSGWGPDAQTRAAELFGDNLRRYSLGLPLRNVVDKAAGY